MAPHAVSALEERIQQVKGAIYRCDPAHVQISKLQTAIVRAESTVKNRREQLWQSPQALAKSQDHHQRKEEEDQGYDTMDLRERIQYDADARHAELIMHQLGVSSSSVHAK